MRYRIFAATLAAGLAAAAAAPAQDLAAGDAEAGERLFRQCQACHTIDEGGPNRTGPNLHGIVGAPVAADEDFRYSQALRDFGGDWSPDRLAAFLEDPRGTVPGTKMIFRGLREMEDRADMIAYLNSQSADPMPIGGAAAEDGAAGDAGGGADAEDDAGDPEDGAQADPAGETEAAAAASGSAGPQPAAATGVAASDLGQLVPGEGAQLTYDVCTACHSEMIVAQQGKTREGWADLLVWMVEEQGMAELPQEDRETVLDYLAEHYNTDRPNFPRR